MTLPNRRLFPLFLALLVCFTAVGGEGGASAATEGGSGVKLSCIVFSKNRACQLGIYKICS